ncbi:MAG TPA: deoxyribonuclease V [Syntrophaceae bacterium]|nr:deoxyribonuclease V [Syntrophaceae bacterium]
MKIRQLHRWDLGYREALKVQETLKERLIFTRLRRKVGLVAGADVSYAKNNNRLYGAVVIIALPSLSLVEYKIAQDKVRFPYIPGLLSFREAPILLKAFKKINVIPDVVLFDGQGTAHPRGLGLASHMGLFLDIPAIGCAKTLLIGESGPVGKEVGSFAYLKNKDEVIGAVLRTKSGIKPVIISPGHRITLDESINIVLQCVRGYRLPEPIRQAHLLVNKFRIDNLGMS